MAVTLATYSWPIATDEHVYTARACGRQRDDGLFEGWIEFISTDGDRVLRSQRETTQPNLPDLQYWATGLTPVFLEGVLTRTLDTPKPRPEPLSAPAFDAPAPSPFVAPPSMRLGDAVLDPFSVYAKSPDLLAQELRALRGWQLRRIIRAYALADEDAVGLEMLSEPELAGVIIRGVAAQV